MPWIATNFGLGAITFVFHLCEVITQLFLLAHNFLVNGWRGALMKYCYGKVLFYFLLTVVLVSLFPIAQEQDEFYRIEVRNILEPVAYAIFR